MKDLTMREAVVSVLRSGVLSYLTDGNRARIETTFQKFLQSKDLKNRRRQQNRQWKKKQAVSKAATAA